MPPWIDAKVVIAFCSLLVASGVFLWNWERSRKGPVYSISSNPVLESTKGLHGTLLISYDSGDGKLTPVRDVYTARLTIKNAGHQEITKQDLDFPLNFTVPEPTKILGAAIGPCEPEILASHAVFNLSAQKTLTLNPILLNRKDSVSFSLVLSDLENSTKLSEKMICDGRIKGIHRIQVQDEDRRIWGNVITSMVAGMLMSMIMEWLLGWFNK